MPDTERMSDYGFIAQPQVPNAMNSLGSMLDIAGKAQQLQTSQQAYQSGNIDLQKAQQANDERLRLQQFMANPDNFQTNGRIDLDKANATIPKIAPYTGGEVLQKLSVLSGAQTSALQAKQNFTQSTRGLVANALGILGRQGIQDPAAYANELDNLKAAQPNDRDLEQYIEATKKILSLSTPGAHVADTAIKASQSMMGPAEQQSALSPQATTIETGGEIQQKITQPPVGGNAPSVQIGQNAPGQSVRTTLPPATVTYSPSGQAQFVGQPPAAAQLPATRLSVPDDATARDLARKLNGQGPFSISVGQPAGQPTLAGAPPGIVQSQLGTVEAINKHWEQTLSQADRAGTDIGVLQNLKALAPKAILGVETDRRSYIDGIRGLLASDQKTQGLFSNITGAKTAQDAKTATDIFIKNANMSSLGGNTDALRGLLESTNPNVHMTPGAVREAANQIIAQRKLALAKQDILGPVKGLQDKGIVGPEVYNATLAKINKIDPRILQLAEMTDEEKKAMIGKMSESEYQAFKRMGIEAHQLGIKP
jgi:hypothetical protein